MPNSTLSTHFKKQRGSTNQILALFLIALAFSALIVTVIGYKFGYRQGVHSVERAVATNNEAVANVSELTAENMQLKQEMTTAIQERDISRSTLDNLRTDYENLKTTNLKLEQVNELLKNSVAEQGGVALSIMASEIISLPENTFEYRFDVSMLDISGKAVKMIPKLTLLNETSMVEIPLEPSSYDIRGVANIRGRFIMPEGFEPKQMKLELAAGDQKVQQLYNWQIGKIVTNAPPSLAQMSNASHRPIEKNTQ
ncbi:hypothetical protein U0021_00710 [Moraxella canis]|uniref:DUF3450 domain-containing protein n=1 Tax=Moraxella canis TaxID=90239 RepID=A0ABZ0WY15_9GAMM|nr:hypothetical protein [Moraxella canis]WQE04157.1 hypothetical protein U0021_00710 [Moraxella canis]